MRSSSVNRKRAIIVRKSSAEDKTISTREILTMVPLGTRCYLLRNTQVSLDLVVLSITNSYLGCRWISLPSLVLSIWITECNVIRWFVTGYSQSANNYIHAFTCNVDLKFNPVIIVNICWYSHIMRACHTHKIIFPRDRSKIQNYMKCSEVCWLILVQGFF